MIAKRPFAKFVFVQIEELLSTQALGYFPITCRVRRKRQPASFKSRSRKSSAIEIRLLPQHGSPRISDER
jgi:hypothetical protein